MMIKGMTNKTSALKLVLVLQCLFFTPLFAFGLDTSDTITCHDSVMLCDSIVTESETGKEGENEPQGWDNLAPTDNVHTFLSYWRVDWLAFHQACITQCLASPLSIRAPPPLT